MNNIGAFIRKQRIKRSMSQQKLADLVGVSKSAISRYESGEIGNMGIDKARNMAIALGINPALFVSSDNFFHDEDINFILDVFSDSDLQIKLFNEDDPDWAILFRGKNYSSDCLEELHNLAEDCKNLAFNEKDDLLTHFFDHINRSNLRDAKSRIELNEVIFSSHDYTITSPTRTLKEGAEPFIGPYLDSMTEPKRPSREEILLWLNDNVQFAAYSGANYEDWDDDRLYRLYLELKEEVENKDD